MAVSSGEQTLQRLATMPGAAAPVPVVYGHRRHWPRLDACAGAVSWNQLGPGLPCV